MVSDYLIFLYLLEFQFSSCQKHYQLKDDLKIESNILHLFVLGKLVPMNPMNSFMASIALRHHEYSTTSANFLAHFYHFKQLCAV